MSDLMKAIQEESQKIFTAFFTWGLGLLFMVVYCSIIYFLNKNFGIYATIGGALLYLTLAFFVIDLWWSSKRPVFRE